MAKLVTVGSKIRACRKAAKMTQEKLAERVKISPTYLSEIETDRKQAGREVLCRIAKVLDVEKKCVLNHFLVAGGLLSSFLFINGFLLN